MGADVSVDMDSGCNSVVVIGLTVSRGAGSVTVIITSATVAEVVLIAANLNQCHEVFSFASYEVIISYVEDKNVSIIKQIIMVRDLNYTSLYTPTFHHHAPFRVGGNRLCTPEYIYNLEINRISKNAHYLELSYSTHALFNYANDNN